MGTLNLFFTSVVQLGSLIACWVFLGLLYAHLRGERLSFHLLFQVLMGMILLFASVFALIQTKGQTILLLYFPLLAYYGFINLRERKTNLLIYNLSQWKIIALLALFFFCWSFFSLFNVSLQGIYLPSGLATQENDFFIYAQRAKYLAASGQENYYGLLSLLDAKYQGASPYHYLELWLGGGLSKMFGIPHVYSLGLLVKPLFYLATATGILAIMELKYTSIRYMHVLLVIALFFVSGLFVNSSWLNLPQFNLSILSYRFKMLVYYPFLLGFMLMILNKKQKEAFLFLAALMVASVVTIPAILGGSILYFLLQEFRKNTQLRIPCLIICLSASAILLFYYMAPSPQLQTSLGLDKQEVFAALRLSSLPGIFLHIMKNLGVVFVVFGSSLFLIFGAWKKIPKIVEEEKQAFTFFLCLILAGAISFALLASYENAIQLFYNPAIASLNLAAILVVIGFFQDKKYRKWVALFLLLTLANQAYILGPKLFGHHVNPNYSASYLQKIKSYAAQGKLSSIGGVLKGAEDYFSAFSKITFAYTGAYYLLYFPGESSCISLSDFEISIDPKNKRNNQVNRNSGYFYQFVVEQKKKGEFVSIEKSQAEAIQELKINFLVLSKGVTISPEINLWVKEKLVDSLSGEQFYLLQKP